MSKVVLNSSVIIALSTLGHLDKLVTIFKDILIAEAVYEEICSKGRGLVGESELRELVESNKIAVKEIKNRLLVNALLDPLAMGEAETISLAIEENADQIVLDDKVARRKAKTMKLIVVGTLRVLRLMYDAKLINKKELINSLERLSETGFRISEDIINEIRKGL